MKNTEVEEPIDLAVHRPLGYAIARACYPFRVSPDTLTIVSMLCGIAAGISVYFQLGTPTDGLWLGGLLFVISAVFDCSDGQLARMRGGGSRWGRMLDGAVDAVVQIAVVPAAVLHMIIRHGGFGSGDGILWGVMGTVAVLVGVRHTTLYDQFKNVYVRNTERDPKDCDDADDVEAAYRTACSEGPMGLLTSLRWSFYRAHMQLVASTMRVLDPHIPARFKDMPGYTHEGAQRFRGLNRLLMRGWSFFGIGTHIFLFGVSLMFNAVEVYAVVRIVLFNVLLVAMLPAQRRASRAFFAEGPTEPLRAAA